MERPVVVGSLRYLLRRFGGTPLSLFLLGTLLLLVTACSSPRVAVSSRPFEFPKDTFAYANELTWDYHYDENGRWVSEKHAPKPDYTLHCFVVARAAKQFFQNARFDSASPRLDRSAYRKLIARVVATSPRKPLPDDQKIVIPGYGDLRSFSTDYETLLKQQCGKAWESYFQRGHWRMLMPFSRRGQAKEAKALLKKIKKNQVAVVHIVAFPKLTINHAVLLFDSEETSQGIRFTIYDPNDPREPRELRFESSSRRFYMRDNAYFPGGYVNAYEVYHSSFY